MSYCKIVYENYPQYNTDSLEFQFSNNPYDCDFNLNQVKEDEGVWIVIDDYSTKIGIVDEDYYDHRMKGDFKKYLRNEFYSKKELLEIMNK